MTAKISSDGGRENGRPAALLRTVISSEVERSAVINISLILDVSMKNKRFI